MLKAYSVFKDLSKEACDKLRENKIELVTDEKREYSNDDLKDLLNKYDILIISIRQKLTKDLLEQIKTPKIISTLSIGLDHIDESFLESELVKVVNCPTANVISVAEHIFGLILALNKRIIESNELVKDKKNRTYLSRSSMDINHKAIGLIGSGKISRAVIKIARAFHMKIYCYTINPDKNKDLLEEGVIFTDLDTLLTKSDIISVNIPLTEKNKDFISKEKISLMKKTATFINTARAEIVDTRSTNRICRPKP
jgi:phosphoglycerate dehydrogenase-like enzyme